MAPVSPAPSVIGIDSRLYFGDYTGIGIYTRNLIDNLNSLGSGHRYILFADRRIDPPGEDFTAVRIPGSKRIIWTQFSLPLKSRGLNLDLFHATANYELPLLLTLPSVITVHDLIPLIHPETVPRRHRLVFRSFIGPAVKKAKAVITDSGFVRQSLISRFGLPDSRVFNIPLGHDPSFSRPAPAGLLDSIRAKYGLREKYILYVGAMEPRKNIPSLISAFGRAIRDPDLRDWQLVLAGHGGWHKEKILAPARAAGLGDSLVMTGFIPSEELPALYQQAAIFAYPSIYEGFGLPVLEAMASGRPVLVSRPSALEELVGEAGAVFDLNRTADLENKLTDLMKEEGLRDNLSEAARKRASIFSWERCAERTLAVYNRVLGYH